MVVTLYQLYPLYQQQQIYRLEKPDIVLRGTGNTFATFSEHALNFSWQAQHFGRVQRHFSWQAQHFRRVVHRVYRKSHWHGCEKC